MFHCLDYKTRFRGHLSEWPWNRLKIKKKIFQRSKILLYNIHFISLYKNVSFNQIIYTLSESLQLSCCLCLQQLPHFISLLCFTSQWHFWKEFYAHTVFLSLSNFPFNPFPIGFQTSHFTWMALEVAKTLAVSHPLSWNPFSETSSWLSPSLSLPHFARVRAILITTSKVLPPLCIVFQITLNYFPSKMYNHIAYFIFYVICLSVTPNILSVILNSYLL